MSVNVDFNPKYEDTSIDLQEELVINNINFTSLPSDISAYSTNAVFEDGFMRSKAVFSVRSKYAKGKIILTFPISLDMVTDDNNAVQSRQQGFSLLTQANNYPFVFVKSSRIHSYLGDNAKKSSTGFLLFAVDEIKVIHIIDVQDVLFLELSLIYSDHTSQVEDFKFLANNPSDRYDTVDSLEQSKLFGDFASKLQTKHGEITDILDDMLLMAREQSAVRTNEKGQVVYTPADDGIVAGAMPFSKVFLFAPQILDKNNYAGILAAKSFDDAGIKFEPKVINITEHLGDTALTRSQTDLANGRGVDPVTGEAVPLENLNMNSLYVMWKAFHDLECGGDGSIQRVVCTRKNKLATLFIGTHKNPFVQYMGRHPGTVEINMTFLSGDAHRLNTPATISALNSIASIIDYNNAQFPEASIYNTLKMRSVASAALNIENIVPSQTSITTSASQQGVEDLTITFVESHMEEFLEIGRATTGRTMRTPLAGRDTAIITYLNLVAAGGAHSAELVEFHKGILNEIVYAFGAMDTELNGGAPISEGATIVMKNASEAISKFPANIPKDFIKKAVNNLGSRETIIKSIADRKENPDNWESQIVSFTPTTSKDKQGKVVEGQAFKRQAEDVFKQQGVTDKYLDSVLLRLNELRDRGDKLALAALTSMPEDTISASVDAKIRNYTGTNIPDLNLDLVGETPSEEFAKTLSPFFFVRGYQYFYPETIEDAVKVVSDPVDEIYSQLIQKSVTGDTKLQEDFKTALLTEEKEFGELSTAQMFVDGGDGTTPVTLGVPPGPGTPTSGYIKDWNITEALTPEQRTMKFYIENAVMAEKQIPDNEKELWKRFSVQVMGKESTLGTNKKQPSTGIGGLAQLGWKAVSDVEGKGKASAKATWQKQLTDPELSARIGVAYLRQQYDNWKKSAGDQLQILSHAYGAYNLGPTSYSLIVNKSGGLTQNTEEERTAIQGLANNIPGSTVLDGSTVVTGSAANIRSYRIHVRDYMAPVLYRSSPVAAPQDSGNVALNNAGKAVKDSADTTVKVKVEEIIDGDTIRVFDEKTQEKYTVRFAKMDAPETEHIVKGPRLYYNDGASVTPNVTQTGQYYGQEAKAKLTEIIGKGGVGQYIYVSASTSAEETTRGRPLKVVQTIDKQDIALKMVQAGAARPAATTDTALVAAHKDAVKQAKGQYNGKQAVITPQQHRDTVWAADEARVVAKTMKDLNLDATKNAKAVKDSQGPNRTVQISKMNDFRPVPHSNSSTAEDGKFGVPREGVRTYPYHTGIDFATSPPKTPLQVKAAAAGKVTRARWQQASVGGAEVGYGLYIQIDHENGYVTTYGHLSKKMVNALDYVQAGQVIAMSGDSGRGGYHVHYQVDYHGTPVNPYATPLLSSIPKGVSYKDPLYSPGDLAYAKDSRAWYERWYSAVRGGVDDTSIETSSSESTGDSEDDYQRVINRNIEAKYSVFNEAHQIKMQSQIMAYLQNYHINVAYPCIKAYITIGNENEDAVINNVVPLDQYFEITGIQDFKLVCNDDTNPVDMVTMRIANPSFIREDKYAIAGIFLTTDVMQLGTDLEAQFALDRMTLKAGMKLHIRAGYGNSPSDLKTVFNGSITELGTSDNYAMDLVCEGFGKELLNYEISPHTVSKAGGTFTNSSTPLIFGAALNVDTIAHFGSRFGFWRVMLAGITGAASAVGNGGLAIANAAGEMSVAMAGAGTVAEIQEAAAQDVQDQITYQEVLAAQSAADNPSQKAINANRTAQRDTLDNTNKSGLTMNERRDPDAKRLTTQMSKDCLFGLNLRLSNYKQRIFTNIYAAEIEELDGEFTSSFANYGMNLFSFNRKAGYHYLFYKTTPWQAMKEMEWRHPGTLTKPLLYEDRATIFYGIKEQLYIARDLDPVFMASVSQTEDLALTQKYLQQRPKRFDVVCGFHIISSNLNLLNNTMGLNTNYATGVEVLFFEDAGDAKSDDRSNFQMAIDDDLAAWDMRYKTISYNGCHGRFSSYMYGINELRREAETMYSGKIRVIGDPTIKAGDYAYLSDDHRKLTGIIKIRECIHSMNSEEGFITEITPGQYVECRKFIHSMLFLKLGFATKAVLAASELAVKATAIGDTTAATYYDTFTTIASWSNKDTTKDLLTMAFATEGTGGVPQVLGALTFLLIAGMKVFTMPGSKTAKIPLIGALANGTLAVFKNYGRANAKVNQSIDIARILRRAGITATKDLINSTTLMTKFNEFNAARLESAKTALEASKAKHAAKGIVGRGAATTGRGILWLLGGIIKLPFKIITSPAKLLLSPTTGRILWMATRAMAAVATIVSVALMSNPIGWLVDIVLGLVMSYVSMKIDDAEYGRNPLVFFPVVHIGRPYAAGMTGYNYNSYWESKKLQWDKNMKEVVKAAIVVGANGGGTTLVSVAANAVASTGGYRDDIVNKQRVAAQQAQAKRAAEKKKVVKVKAAPTSEEFSELPPEGKDKTIVGVNK